MSKIQSLEQSRAEQSRAEQSRAEQLNGCIRLGNINGKTGGSFAGQVYDSKWCCPTLTDMQGGGRQPHIVEVKKMETKILGGLEEGSNQRRVVYDSENVSPTLQAAMGNGGGNVPLVTEQVALKMERTEEGKRLRKEYESGELKHGFNEHRQAVPRTDGLSNTLTSVQKDNIVLETKYIAIDEQNNCTREDIFGCLTTDGSSPKHNNRVCEISNPLKGNSEVGWHFAQNVYDENSECVRSVKAGEGSGNIPKVIKIRQATKEGFIECQIGGVTDLSYPTSKLRRGRVQGNGQISPTLTTENIPNLIELGDPDFYNFLYEIDGEIYLIRIRKLIPKECWKLMGFTEEDFYKAEKVNSNTQLYKQAGNSIVKDVLMAIFSQMNIKGVEPWNEKKRKSSYLQ